MEGMVRCCAPSLVLVAALGAAYVGAQQVAHERADACDQAIPHEPTPPPIMTLRTRDHEVAVYRGDALGFTVLDHHGRVLAERIDEDAFADRFPSLHEQLERAFAGEHAWIDATALPRRDGTAAVAF